MEGRGEFGEGLVYRVEFDSPAIVEENLCLWLRKDLRITYHQPRSTRRGGLLKSRVNDSEDAGGCITFCPIHSLYNVSILDSRPKGNPRIKLTKSAAQKLAVDVVGK
jgi:hypothetical protein